LILFLLFALNVSIVPFNSPEGIRLIDTCAATTHKYFTLTVTLSTPLRELDSLILDYDVLVDILSKLSTPLRELDSLILVSTLSRPSRWLVFQLP